MSLHCLPIRARSMNELEQRLNLEGPNADVVEIWLDSIKDLRLAEIFFEGDRSKKPILFVNKAPFEGGDFLGTPEERVEWLVEVLERGAPYVDVAMATDARWIKKLSKAKKKNARLILSYHNFKETPSFPTLKNHVRQAVRRGADMVKIATFVRTQGDNVTLFELTRWAVDEKIQIITVGMGKEGRLSRVVCPLLGSALHYAPLARGNETAPGQLTQSELEMAWALLLPTR